MSGVVYETIDYRRLGDDSSDLIVAFDADFRYVYVNPPVLRLIGKPLDYFLGRTIWEVAPHTRGTSYAINYERAMREHVLVEFEDYYAPLTRWNRVRCVPQPDGGLIVFARTTTEEHLAEAKREAAMSALVDSEAQLKRSLTLLNAVVNGTADIVAAVDCTRRIIMANTAAARFLGYASPEQIIDRPWPEVLPGEIDRPLADSLMQADDEVIASGQERSFEFSTGSLSVGTGWKAYLVNKAPLRDAAGGSVVGVVSVLHDITERKNRERRERFLSELTERTRLLDDPEAVLWEAVCSTGKFLDVERCTYVEADEEAGTLTTRREWLREGHPTLPRIIPLSTYGEKMLAQVRSGKPLVISNLDDIHLSAAEIAEFSARQSRSLLFVPVHKNGVWVGSLGVSSSSMRDWTPEEVELLATVAERTRLTLENARLFRESRERADREAYLSEVSYLLSTSMDYEATLAAIARLAVPRFADWCLVDTLNPHGNKIECVAIEHVNRDMAAWGWELRRRYPVSVNDAHGVGAVLSTGRTEFTPYITVEMLRSGAEDDAHFDILKSLALRSAIVVPLAVHGKALGALSLIATEDSNRLFTADDSRLAEEIGRRAAMAIENARLFREVQNDEARQRRIADTLQRSLLLAPPSAAFEGFAVDAHYEAASDEAFVGGDFGDAFRIDEHHVALLVGDCTGKGLAAARFVGECQFTARTFFRLHAEEPSKALTLLNRMILDGQQFDDRPETALACLAAAVVDVRTGVALFASAGAEPPIILRAATGLAEEVHVGGPLLGMHPQSDFDSVQLRLNNGDMIVLTTDGTTEARDRRTRQLFGYAGLLHAVESVGCAQTDIEGCARQIVTRAKDFANGDLTDDACVLVGKWL